MFDQFIFEMNGAVVTNSRELKIAIENQQVPLQADPAKKERLKALKEKLESDDKFV